MMYVLFALAIAAGGPPPPIVAGPLEIHGRLVVDGVGVDGLHDFAVTYRDEGGIDVGGFDASGVVVVAGDFEFAVVDDDALYAAAAAGDLVVEVSVVDDFDGVSAVAVVGAVPFASEADSAAFAEVANVADALGALTDVELVSAAALASTATDPVVALGNVAVPADLLDGDQGTIDTIGAGLVNSPQLDVAAGAVDSARIIDGTVRSAAIEDGSVTSVNVGATASADLAAATLTGADFEPGRITSTQVAGNKIGIFRLPLACDLEQPLTTSSASCTRRTCSTAGQVRDCNTGNCVVGTGTTCFVVSVGATLFAP